MKLKVILLLSILLIVTLATRPRIFWNEYQEECFEYETEKYVANWTTLDYADGWYCYFPDGYWGLNCSLVEKVTYYNSTRFTDKCLKYHLVRHVE
jgi:hypothetical protein